MKRKSVLIAIALSSVCSAAGGSSFAQVDADETRWTKMIDDALMYETIGETNNAEANYQQALVEARAIDKEGPHVIRTLCNFGDLQQKIGKSTEAESSLREAQRIAAAMPGRDGKVWQSEVLGALAYLFGEQNKRDDKIKALAEQAKIDAALEKDPSDFSGGFSRLQYSVRKNWHPPANQISRLVTVDWQTDKSGHFELIHTSHSSGDAATDEAAIGAVRSMSDTNALPQTALGPVSMRMDFKYNRFNKDGSQIPTAYAKSAVSVEGSLKDLQDAEASVGPDSPSLIAHLLTLGYSYDGAGRYADGEAVSKRALKIYDKNNESDSVLLCNIYCLLGHIQANKKELAEAEKSFKLALEATEDRMNPTVSAARAQAVNEYSTLLYRLKRSSDARELK